MAYGKKTPTTSQKKPQQPIDPFAALKSLTGSKLNIVAIGKAGEGKSATLNTLVKCAGDRTKCFQPVSDVLSVSVATDQRVVNLFGFNTRLVDTIGLFDSELTAPERAEQRETFNMPELDSPRQVVLNELTRVMTWCDEGVHAFLLVNRADSMFTKESEETIDIILRYFGPQLMDYVFFVFTHADCADEKQMKDAQIKVENCLIKKGYSRLIDRFISMDNIDDTKVKQQATDMITKIQKNMIQKKVPYQRAAFVSAQEMWKEKIEKSKRKRDQLEAQTRAETEKLECQYRNITSSLEQQIAQQAQMLDRIQIASEEERRTFHEKQNKQQTEDLQKLQDQLAKESDNWNKQLKEELQRMQEHNEKLQHQLDKLQSNYLQAEKQHAEEIARVKREISISLEVEFNKKVRDMQDQNAKQGFLSQRFNAVCSYPENGTINSDINGDQNQQQQTFDVSLNQNLPEIPLQEPQPQTLKVQNDEVQSLLKDVLIADWIKSTARKRTLINEQDVIIDALDALEYIRMFPKCISDTQAGEIKTYDSRKVRAKKLLDILLEKANTAYSDILDYMHANCNRHILGCMNLTIEKEEKKIKEQIKTLVTMKVVKEENPQYRNELLQIVRLRFDNVRKNGEQQIVLE